MSNETQTGAEILKAAIGLGPKIQDAREEIERERHLPMHLVEAMRYCASSALRTGKSILVESGGDQMNKVTAALAIVGMGVWFCAPNTCGAEQTTAKSNHVAVTPDELKWEPFPAAGPGAELAIIEGDLNKAGSKYVARLKLPDGGKIPPHWHPKDEHVTVMSGTLCLGTGEKFDATTCKDLPPGSYFMMPAKMRHFALSKGESVTQAHGVGPWKIIYVNPLDDPSKRSDKAESH